jgi:transcriptional regulator with XRE-family HTH domain
MAILLVNGPKMQIKAWRLEQGWSQIDLAAALRCDVSTIHRYETGARVPEHAAMLRIYAITNGRVMPNDFYDLPDLRASQLNGAPPRETESLAA